MPNTAQPPRVGGLSEIAGDYRYVLCDAWGVLHNGVRAYPAAVDALIRARAAGIVVLVLTNAPRPAGDVLRQFDRFGVDHGAFDGVVTSGEAARAWLRARSGSNAYYLGAERDRAVFDGLGLNLTGPEEATLVACAGLVDDERETPEDYAERMKEWAARGLLFVCANPDKVVERGDRILWCAGALAEQYAALGGRTVLFGKPHAPIYATALARFAEIAGTTIDPAAVLAIGDAAETDLKGANDAGLDVLFVTAGIHADRFGPRHDPDGAAVAAFLAGHGFGARGYVPHLAW